jgi:hypothetical protein
LEDITKKIGWSLIVASSLMIFLLISVLISNYFSIEKEVKVSGFYLALILVFLFSGYYLIKISKRI